MIYLGAASAPIFYGASVTKQDIFNKLIILSANNLASNSYRDEDVLKAFCGLPLSDLVDFWEGMTDQTKMKVVSSHQDELLTWIRSSRSS